MSNNRILIAIPHFFKAEERPTHAYNDGSKIETRKKTIRDCILRWRHMYGSGASELIIKDKVFKIHNSGYKVDIALLIHEDNHLIDSRFLAEVQARTVACKVDDPRMLGFCAHKFFKDNLDKYDVFIYSEDDLYVCDFNIIDKIVYFSELTGGGSLLFPNRFEYNLDGPSGFTYIDGPVSSKTQVRLKSYVDGPEFIKQSIFGSEIIFNRATNPHSGFFLLTKNQLQRWVSSKSFLDLDCSFVSPLESASSLSLSKEFSIYKTAGNRLSYCSIMHMSNL